MTTHLPHSVQFGQRIHLDSVLHDDAKHVDVDIRLKPRHLPTVIYFSIDDDYTNLNVPFSGVK